MRPARKGRILKSDQERARAFRVAGCYRTTVGPGLSYSLTLFYNAQAWDYELPETCKDIFGTSHTYSLPKPVEGLNAGFGWSLHLGRLKNGNVYVSPDGAEHYFHSQLHPGYPATPGNAFYTQDSSYLRLRQLSSGCGGGGGCKVVEFPDGSAREFKAFGNLTTLTTNGSALGLSPNATTNRLGGGTYDAAGNLTVITLGGVRYEYGFEAAGQLEFMRSNNHQATVYFYDAADERLLSWDCPNSTPNSSCGNGSALEHWTLRGLGGEVLRTFEGKSSGALAWKEDFVYRGGQTLAAVRPTATGFEERLDIHTDHLGSTRQITNSAGIEVERHTFYPFGEEATANQATDIPLKFTGHERDRNAQAPELE